MKIGLISSSILDALMAVTAIEKILLNEAIPMSPSEIIFRLKELGIEFCEEADSIHEVEAFCLFAPNVMAIGSKAYIHKECIERRIMFRPIYERNITDMDVVNFGYA